MLIRYGECELHLSRYCFSISTNTLVAFKRGSFTGFRFCGPKWHQPTSVAIYFCFARRMFHHANKQKKPREFINDLMQCSCVQGQQIVQITPQALRLNSVKQVPLLSILMLIFVSGLLLLVFILFLGIYLISKKQCLLKLTLPWHFYLKWILQYLVFLLYPLCLHTISQIIYFILEDVFRWWGRPRA